MSSALTIAAEIPSMGIVLQPWPSRPPLSVAQFADMLDRAGLVVTIDRDRAKRGVIEQIVLTYTPHVDAQKIDFTVFDRLVADYDTACDIEVIDDSNGLAIPGYFASGNEIRFGECFPTDTEPASKLVMRIASIIDYEVLGE